MLDFMHPQDDAINILKKDHDKVKDLFDRFEKTNNRREKESIAEEAMQALKIHAAIEEEIFYPAIRRQQGVEEYLMNQSDEEHHVAKLLIAELDQMNGSEEYYDAKFHVLAENVRHHIKEEEGKVMPEARKTDIDFEALGKKLLSRKQALMQEGVPVSAEENMISRYGQAADSPAQNRRRQPGMAGAARASRSGYASESHASPRRAVAGRGRR